MQVKHFLIIAVFLMVLPIMVFASPLNWAAHGSIFFFPAENGVDSDPAPILPSLGFSLSWDLINYLNLEFTQDMYFTNYEYNWERGHPMACNPENRSAFVMGFVTGFQAVGIFPVGNSEFRVFGGPAFDFRVVTVAFGLHPILDFTGDEFDAKLQTEAIKNYFWGKGRMIMPVAGFGFDFPLNEKILIGFDLRTWFPVYKLWVNDNTSIIDGWRFGAGLRITPRR